MPRFRRRMQAPINTRKHFVPFTNTVVANGVRQALTVVQSVVAPAVANVFEVKEGSVLKAIHVEYWIINTGATNTDTQFIFTVEKVPVGAPGVTFTNMSNLMSYENKRNIFYTSQGVLGPQIDGSPSIPVIKDWLLIPKGKQRFGLGDRIQVSLAAIGTTINFCGISIYKEYT